MHEEDIQIIVIGRALLLTACWQCFLINYLSFEELPLWRKRHSSGGTPMPSKVQILLWTPPSPSQHEQIKYLSVHEIPCDIFLFVLELLLSVCAAVVIDDVSGTEFRVKLLFSSIMLVSSLENTQWFPRKYALVQCWAHRAGANIELITIPTGHYVAAGKRLASPKTTGTTVNAYILLLSTSSTSILSSAAIFIFSR